MIASLIFVDCLSHQVGERVAIIGAGGIGFDVAEFLAHGADRLPPPKAPAQLPAVSSLLGGAEHLSPRTTITTAAFLDSWGIDATNNMRGGLLNAAGADAGAVAGAVAEPETKRARPRLVSSELRELATAPINALKTFKSLLVGEVGAAEVTVLRAQSRSERELLHAQALAHMAELLRSGEIELMIRPVPISLSMAALTAALAEEKRVGVRDMLTRAFEVDYPTHADMLGQASDL